MSKQVSCTKKDGSDADRRLDGIGGVENGTRWYKDIDAAIADVRRDPHAYYTSVSGKSVWVVAQQHKNGTWYLTTEGDGFPPNNLLKLPDCP